MPTKSVREMSAFRRRHHSLSAKIFRAIIVFSLVVCTATIAFGYFLYNKTVQQQYISLSYNIAKTATLAVSESDVDEFVVKTIKIYEAAPHDLVENQDDEDYRRLFSSIEEDSEFNRLRKKLDDLCRDNDAKWIYYAVLDMKNNRMIYVMDSDQTADYCPPGYWEEVSQKDMDTYRGFNKPGLMEKYMSRGKVYPALISDTEEFGYICSACNTVGEYGDYDICILADTDMNKAADMSRKFLIQYVAVVLLITVLIACLLVLRMHKKIAEPINDMSDAAMGYSRDKKAGVQTECTHFSDLDIQTGDEIENLSLIMKDMEGDIAVYEKDLARAVGEKERIGAELDMASQIQHGMLPDTFPPFPDHEEFDIFASMDPAREVGGDFYDLFLIDDDHMGMVMADVAGKGVPAALYMMVSKILLNTHAGIDKVSPAEILERVNTQMCGNENIDMFVTVWLGILEISTGRMKAANAGHEYPALCRAGGKYELLRDKHGFVLGGLEGSRYSDYEIDFEPGDRIFLYTDGVTEASDSRKQLFGTDRMLEALNDDPKLSAEKTLEAVKKKIREFTEGEEPFDDITMMCLRYLGREGAQKQEQAASGSEPGEKAGGDGERGGSDNVKIEKLRGPVSGAFGSEYVFETEARADNLHQVMEFVDSHLEDAGCSMKTQMEINVAVEEIFINISNYAYAPDEGSVGLIMKVKDDPKEVIITIADSGVPYDPLSREDPDITLSADEREIGGLGVFMVKEVMDDVRYEYKDGMNVLTLKKKIQ